MSIRLRDYQKDAISAVRDDLGSGVRRPAVVLPTGGGKTIVFSALAETESARGRVLILAHREELINQAAGKYRNVNPGADIGIVKAERNETDHQVIVSSVQTLARPNRRAALSGIGLGIVDECHHATADSYLDVMNHFDVPWVGFSATLARGDGKALGEVWEKVSYEYPLLRAIRQGYLVDVAGIGVRVPDLDMSNLRKTAGDYREGELGERLEASLAPETVAKAYREHGVREDGSVRPGILFAPTVATAHLFADALREEGFRVATVWGAMPKEERRAILGDESTGTLGSYDRGEIDVLCNCMVLTEGFDSPRAEVAVIARPTRSAPLYVQMVGRVLRLFPGKGRALVLDVVGAAENHELATLAELGGEKLTEVKEGQSLLKALDELEAEEEAAEADALGYVGAVESKALDLFAGSRQSWLSTDEGHWFIPAGARVIAVIPGAGGVGLDVAWFNLPNKANGYKGKGGGYIARGLTDLSMAMAHGEGSITWDEEVMSAKDRSWRKKKASAAQVSFARRLGIRTIPEGIRAGAIGDLISIKMASNRIDPVVRKRIPS